MSKTKFEVTILGCGSASPTVNHTASSQVVSYAGEQFMIDCGECAQYQICKADGVSASKIKAMFISHIHGDHTFGMVGMIAAMALNGRTRPLDIFAPHGVHEFLQPLIDLFCGKMTYELHFHETDTTKHEKIYETSNVEVWTIPLSHSEPSHGFLFKEKPGFDHINIELIDKLGIDKRKIKDIKNGYDVQLEDGTVIKNSDLLLPADEPRSYAYCADTEYLETTAEYVKNVSVLYHEASFKDEEIEKAIRYKHSTAKQAATVAKDAHVGRLFLGHLSARYATIEETVLDEAKEIFAESYLSDELMKIEIS